MTGPRRGDDLAAQPERVYAWYLGAQAVVGVLLWVALGASSTVRGWFDLLPGQHAVMDAFVFGDLAVIVVGSSLGAWAVAAGKSWAVPVTAFTAGAVVYPTLYLLGWVSFTNGSTGTIALLVMVGVSTLTCFIAYKVWRLAR